MKNPPSYKDDFFKGALFISLSTHVLFFSLGGFLPAPPQVAVIESPSSMEVVLISEQITPEFVHKKIEPVVHEIEPLDQQKILETIAVPEAEKIPFEELALKVKLQSEQFNIDPPKQKVELQKDFVVNKTDVTQSSIQGAIVKAKPMQAIENPSPIYPNVARRRGWEGIVQLKVLVERDGLPSQVLLEKSSGYKILDESAMKTVEEWKFLAARKGQVKFSSWVSVPIQFQLIHKDQY